MKLSRGKAAVVCAQATSQTTLDMTRVCCKFIGLVKPANKEKPMRKPTYWPLEEEASSAMLVQCIRLVAMHVHTVR
eukprot:1152342-Pelagomonas_calceolata.AAC.4